MTLSKLLNKFCIACTLGLVLSFFSATPVSSGAVYPCDDPNTGQIEQCATTCVDASTCGCQQSAACINNVCSCTVDGIGFPNEYCSACVNNYQSCSIGGGPLYEIRWCGGGSGPVICQSPPAIAEYPVSCDGGPGSFNNWQGFVFRQTHTPKNAPTRLIGFGLTCNVSAPYLGCNNDVGGYLDYYLTYDGYFQADEDAYYQFAWT